MIICVDIVGVSKPEQGLVIRDTLEQALLHLLPRRRLPILIDCHIALKEDPSYKEISKRFHENPEEFADAFAEAWFKLLHRDMGPKSNYIGPRGP